MPPSSSGMEMSLFYICPTCGFCGLKHWHICRRRTSCCSAWSPSRNEPTCHKHVLSLTLCSVIHNRLIGLKGLGCLAWIFATKVPGQIVCQDLQVVCTSELPFPSLRGRWHSPFPLLDRCSSICTILIILLKKRLEIHWHGSADKNVITFTAQHFQMQSEGISVGNRR